MPAYTSSLIRRSPATAGPSVQTIFALLTRPYTSARWIDQTDRKVPQGSRIAPEPDRAVRTAAGGYTTNGLSVGLMG
jgi:hypothetical protein